MDQEEWLTVQDADWLLRKNNIMTKAARLLGALQEAMAAHPVIAGFPLPGAMPPKISKGEQYLGLPYVILDYPRRFAKEDIFACRTFFWWGRFFSITLHLAGEPLLMYRERLLTHLPQLGGWNVCIQDDPWQHHFGEDNYRPVRDIDPAEWQQRMQKPFVKLARRFELSEWEKIIPEAVAGYAALLEILEGEWV